jgi:DNA-binding MarR family transcriptional regulator
MSTGNITPPSSVYERVGYLVKQLQHALRCQMDKELRAIQLSTAQYALLSAIDAQPDSSGADLARRCFITPQSINGIISGLEQSKLISRTASVEHGRIIKSALSPFGRSRLKAANRIVGDIEKRMLGEIDLDQHKELAGMLRQCIDGLRKPQKSTR